jgi:hypothetical protein
MDDVRSWRNPLRALPTISPHPLQSSSGDSSLTPLPSPPRPGSERWHGLRQESTQVLEVYGLSKPGDDTKEVLSAFLKHLSGRGQAILITEVVHCSRLDPIKLRHLRDFLVDAILKPRKLTAYCHTQ